MVRKTANFGFGASQRVLHMKAALFESASFSREWTFQNVVLHIGAARFGSASIQPRMDLPKCGATKETRPAPGVK